MACSVPAFVELPSFCAGCRINNPRVYLFARFYFSDEGIESPGLGSIALTKEGAQMAILLTYSLACDWSGTLRLRSRSGAVITESLPLGRLSCSAVGGRPQAADACQKPPVLMIAVHEPGWCSNRGDAHLERRSFVFFRRFLEEQRFSFRSLLPGLPRLLQLH